MKDLIDRKWISEHLGHPPTMDVIINVHKVHNEILKEGHRNFILCLYVTDSRVGVLFMDKETKRPL